MPDPASSGRRRIGLAQFHRDMERVTARLEEFDRFVWRATGPLRMAEEANKRMSRIVADLAPGKLAAELLGEVEAAPPPRRKTAIVATEVPRPDPARPPAAASRRKRKKPRGKTADQRLAELWETDEGRYWLVATARSVGEVARRIGKGETQTKSSGMWRRIIAVERKAHRFRLKLERWERDERWRC